MKNQQNGLLRKIGSLLLCGSMLLSANAFLASCGNTGSSDNPTTTGTTVPPEPEIEHLIVGEGSYSLYSPDGSLSINIFTSGAMMYNVMSFDEQGNATEWVRASQMGLAFEDSMYYVNATVTDTQLTEIDRSFALLGNQSTVEDHCYELVLTLEQDGYTYYLDVRAYDNGVAFRYRLPDSGTSRKLRQELTTYALSQDVSQVWYGVENQDYEPVIESHDPSEKSSNRICGPMTAVLKLKRGFISVMEGAQTDSFPGYNYVAKGDATYGTTFWDRPADISGEMVSGWRMINVATTLNDLVNNYNVYCVNEPMDTELFADTSWIQPGRSAWSWNVDYSAPGYEQMLEYTEMAAELGYEYNIIDEGWYGWTDYETKLQTIGELGDQYNVKQVLWVGVTRSSSRPDATPNEQRVDQLFDLMQRTHMYGVKMDFWWTETNTYTTELQKYVLTEAAKRQFVVNFHGCNENTGFNVTFPNEVTREAIRGQENVGNSNNGNYTTQASWLNRQLYTRYLGGHADWTPASHTAMQIASIICIDSPFMTVSTDPRLVLSSPAVEFIKSIPTVWDKTVVLSDSVIGQYSVYAKQKDGVWFVGGISSSTQGKAEVKLSEFITDDGVYTAEVWTGGKGSLKSQTLNVTKDDVISIGKLSEGEGFAIRLTKLSLSQYGGKINDAITVTAPTGATVKYTTDGSDPRTSDTAVACNGSITLNESCRLKVAITDGEGKGTMLSYQFNKMD